MSMRDCIGNRLLPPAERDKERHKSVWAVYKIRTGVHDAVSRETGFSDLMTAKARADELNEQRELGADHSFAVYREEDSPPSRRPAAKPGRRHTGR